MSNAQHGLPSHLLDRQPLHVFLWAEVADKNSFSGGNGSLMGKSWNFYS